MKHVSVLFCFLAIVCFPKNSFATVNVNSTTTNATLSAKEIVRLSTAQIEQKVGQRLSFADKASLFLLKRHLKAEMGKQITAEEPKMNRLAIASMICSLVGIFFLQFAWALLAIVFGAISLARISNHKDKFKGKGLAIAGLICAILAVVLIIIRLAASA